jgi:hypothetical protein
MRALCITEHWFTVIFKRTPVLAQESLTVLICEVLTRLRACITFLSTAY